MGSGSGSSLKSPDRRRTKCEAERSILGLDPEDLDPVRTGKQFWSFDHPGRRLADTDHENDQADRAISTGKLNASPRLHTRPINVVVYHGSQGSTRFEVGFPLRCLQRLSRPYIATLPCGWRHNSSTRGTSIPVLSY